MRKNTWLLQKVSATQKGLDCKTVGFFTKSVKKLVKKNRRKSLTRTKRASRHTPVRREEKKRIFSVSPQSRSLFSASFQTFFLTART